MTTPSKLRMKPVMGWMFVRENGRPKDSIVMKSKTHAKMCLKLVGLIDDQPYRIARVKVTEVKKP